MSTENKLFDPGRLRAFAPFLAPGERRQLHDLLNVGASPSSSFADDLRALARQYIDDGDSLKLRAICLLVADLCEQGWDVAVEDDRITFLPPGISRTEDQTIDDIKARIRATLQSSRRRQLQEPSVRKFLIRVEKQSLRLGKRASIVDLIDDGAALANDLRSLEALPENERNAALKTVIDPVVEVAEAGAKCPDTGLALIDIWRYFRHTWAHEYRSIPGRQMLILVRNAARPLRPVIGIAMLASPVMRLSARDQWIGWLRETAEERVRAGIWDADAFGMSLLHRINASIDTLRWDDLAIVDEIINPTETVALRLEQKASGVAFERQQQLRKYYEENRDAEGQVRPHRGDLKSAQPDSDWLAASEDLLFVGKRAKSLAHLIFAKSVFLAEGIAHNPKTALYRMFETKDGKRALDIALTEFRKAGLSSEVADVSICGAVQPYNELLGGKLVALLLTSQEVRDAYAKRYGGQISIIASQMAGRAISKPAGLRILTTTSLYGVGSSQYNRLVLRAQEHPDLPYDINWSTIGKSLTGGFGTLHLGKDTAHALRDMAFARHDARRVNNRFGEGTSPRLRQIREGLDALGIKSDAILHHATPRIFYGCELTSEARSALVGLSEPEATSPSCSSIASAWSRRWLSNRARREETLNAMSALGPLSVRASLHADDDGQFPLPI